MKSALLAAAAVRTAKIAVAGVEITVREVGTLEFAEYGESVKKDRLKATAGIIRACALGDDGQPLFSSEEALVVAGVARVSMTVINKVMELSGFSSAGDEGDNEKHADAS